MSWVAILFFVLQHIPDMISIIREVLALIHKLPKEQREQAKVEIGSAIQSGDDAAVREALSHWHHRCEPGTVGCPMDLIGG